MLFEAENISTGYGPNIVVPNFSVKINMGEIVTLLGGNASGKSTLLFALVGMLPIRQGRLVFDGEDISSQNTYQRIKRGMAVLRQRNNIFPSLTVFENILLSCHSNRSDNAYRKASQRLQKTTKISAKGHLKARQLSGGEKQLVAISSVLVNVPKLVLLDEPFAPLAEDTQESVAREMVRLRDEENTSFLIVEQRGEFALSFSDRAIVLDSGQAIYDGKPDWPLVEPLVSSIAKMK